jgi:Tol biopolymer transport system component/predicted Ser/Thr protein kinase
MPLSPGSKLGVYEILAPIGAGGMGEVYRARDTKLKRDVALKVLPEAFERDPDRMTRFQREAELLAALNHPNIAQIYGVEDCALVMELVEGQTLKGPFPLDTALGYAQQIADALEAAHEKNIVHRDLKPANIIVTPQGVVKVLDFGLAKTAEGPAANPQNSPTLTMRETKLGVILGTAGYMAPEQARGNPVDKRADIWAYGVVLFEMLTGQRLFEGETVSDTLAQVLTKEPDWDRVPLKVRRLLRRCLEKDPKARLRDIGDARLLVEDANAVARDKASVLPWAVAGVLAAVAAIFIWNPWRGRPTAAEPVQLQFLPPANVSTSVAHALSPDGRKLAFPAVGTDGITRLWIRDLNSGDIRALPGVQLRGDPPPAFWSPDSRSIAFDAEEGLQKVDLSGGPPQNLFNGFAISGSWNQDGVIIFGSVSDGIMRIPAFGGAAKSVTRIVPGRTFRQHIYPWFLPDGRRFLYLQTSSNADEQGIYLGSLDTPPEKQNSKRLVATALRAIFVPPTSGVPGQLLFERDGKLMAQSFDTARLELAGEPKEVAEHVGSYVTFGFFSASTNGRLVYRATGPGFQLTWFDRKGNVLGTVAEPGLYSNVALAPDATRAVAARGDLRERSLWLIDFARDATTRFTLTPYPHDYPVWSPDGKRLIFASTYSPTGGHLFQKILGEAQEETLSDSANMLLPTSWSYDGRWLLYTLASQTTRNDVWVMPLTGGEKPKRLVGTEFDESEARFAPDGHWITYTSNESGQNEIYIQAFPNGENRQIVSKGGGSGSHWRADGKELYYLAPDGSMMAVDVTYGRSLELAAPRSLFQTTRGSTGWDVAPNGQRFLLAAPAQQSAQTPFTVVLNWQAGLKK